LQGLFLSSQTWVLCPVEQALLPNWSHFLLQ
jgi:hypothetical protein